MSRKLTMLEEWGCDIDGAMERFLDDEAFYFECYGQVITDPCFDRLCEALEQHDIRSAFDCAHTLKGVIANMGLTPLEQILIDIVEPLRGGDDSGCMEKYKELMEERKKYLEILS
ncbi:MAG: Hpt domain-containing protein [Clostridiaceae bacterium]|nr:Hpt domain-containing protein [Clostridiaceae bacterium]